MNSFRPGYVSSLACSLFPLVVVLASVKQLRKRASDTVIQVLQRGAPAEDVVGGSVLGRPRRVLLGYTPCLGSATWEGGAAPGCGELQDPGPLRALLAPKVRWGAVTGQRRLACERGPGWKCHGPHRREGEERPVGAGRSQQTTCR